MATVRPFAGLRYTEKAGCLADLVAPPYDVLSPRERDRYAAKSEHNVVHLTLPEQRADDRSKFVKYARSAAALADWRRTGAIARDGHPALYRYRQTFSIPGQVQPLTRSSIIALIKIEPYEKGIVLPHEQTFPKHKEDRLRILEATRAHLECIYGLFEDEEGRIHRAIEDAPKCAGIEVTTEDGVSHSLDLIQDPATLEGLANDLAAKKVWIADGHHRYETALAFRQAQGEHSAPIAEDFMMMALSSMSDPGLVMLPTHRIVNSMPLRGQALLDALAPYFAAQPLPNMALLDMVERHQAEHAFGVALPGANGLLLTLKDPEKALGSIDIPGSNRLKMLDVTILHELIFGKLLGLRGLDFFSYTRDAEEALSAVEQGAQAAFLMNPPSIEDMRLIALGGEKMPQKSTYYYPKILSGLVIWSLNDFQ